MEIIDD